MLTFYACVKSVYVRAYHHRLNGVASPGTQKALLIYATLSCIFGPAIGYYDVFYNMPIHCAVTAVFVIGEVMYILTMIGIMSSATSAFAGFESEIEWLKVNRMFTVAVGVFKLGTKALGYNIGIYSAVIEWVLFIQSFYIFHLFGQIMKYKTVTVPAQW